MKTFAPVVLFTYKRLPILRQVVDSLLSNAECSLTALIVYSDGPKTKGDEETINQVRSFISSLKGFKSVEVVFRDTNLGLAQSFITGITETLTRHEKAIFLEDDNLLSNHFLSFMNAALDYYENNEKVICITGYSWPLEPAQTQPYFLRGAETWSMGTWRRGWRNFCVDGNSLLSDIQSNGLVERFRSDGMGFYEMLQSQTRGEIDSWGVRWWASAFVKDLYCLYPNKPLCVSIGYGVDSVHCADYTPLFRRPSDLSREPIRNLPSVVQEETQVSDSIKHMNESLNQRSLVYRITSRFIASYRRIRS